MRLNYQFIVAPLSLFFSLIFSACTGEQRTQTDLTLSAKIEPQICRDLSEIKEDGVLNVITLYNSTGYFLYRGKTMGFEYELMERLADDLNLELRIKVAEEFSDVFKMLESGEGDIIAHGLSVTQSRKKKVDFTNYHYLTHQVLVQRKPKNWRRLPKYKIKRHLVSDPIELIGDTVHIRENTSYYARIQNLEKEIGGEIHIDPVEGGKTTDDIIQKVVNGEIDYTVADYNMASINQTYHPILDISTDISFSQRIAWAVRKNSPELLGAVNKWITKSKKKDFYYVIYNKYFKNKKRYKRQIASEFYSKNDGKISPYDQLIRDNSSTLGWDWRLLSSLIYQESRFEKENESWAGAGGLMQIMPSTAKELGVDDLSDPGDNVKAGTIYLKKMFDRFKNVPDRQQRIKFAMAAYNCGFGHVRDAQRLAEAYGQKPLQWDKSVEEYLLKLQQKKFYTHPQVHYGYVRGAEPFEYVRDIFRRYDHYKELIPEDPTLVEKTKTLATR